MRQREHLGGISEGHGSLAGGIKRREHEDEQGDHAQVRAAVVGDVEAKPRGQQRPRHVGEGEEKQGASAVGVDGPDGGPGEDEVDEAEAPGREQRLQVVGVGLFEDGGRVEGDDVDAAHLLGEHDDPGGEGGAPDARDGEEFDEAGDVVAVADDGGFFDDLRVDVVEVAGGLEGGVS